MVDFAQNKKGDKMKENEKNKIIETEIKEIEKIGGEITNIEKEENICKIHYKDHNCDAYGGFCKVRTVKFQKEEEKPQSGEVCPHCGNRIEKKHKFCPQCGQKIEKKEKQNGIKFCPHCGQKIGENNIFCPHCGQKITSGGE